MERVEQGRIRLSLPDGGVREFGQGEMMLEGNVRTWDVFERILRRGDIALAEAFTEGSFETERPDQLVTWACNNEAKLRKAIYGLGVALVFDKIRHWRNKNTVAQARKNIASHYDLGNDFYRLWLDPTLTYSSALFTPEMKDLEEAQGQKYERILQQTGAKPGDHILEIGCGWGGFFSHAVRTRGCRVTAVTISKAQFEFCRQRVAREGLEGHVTLVLEDYRKLTGTYDHVVSIEMIEAVGRTYWPSYFAKVRECLKPGGRAVIQSITIREDLFRSYARGTDFIQQYIFPGGLLPTPSAVDQHGKAAGLDLANSHAFGLSYERTLREWRERFIRARADVRRLGFDEQFLRLWEFYLAYCEGAFRAGRVGVSHFTLAAPVES